MSKIVYQFQFHENHEQHQHQYQPEIATREFLKSLNVLILYPYSFYHHERDGKNTK